eukprot:TRINITY_DN18096_c0_g1_i4.p1 TRINITY_DN18096_c0_g1~~TRINITY_DN18096_c0_g1_i4.p1  ORF type:complete len:318 (+),score=64.35 TRINITY_DN18096_c0_g1_i4:63-956(+)
MFGSTLGPSKEFHAFPTFSIFMMLGFWVFVALLISCLSDPAKEKMQTGGGCKIPLYFHFVPLGVLYIGLQANSYGRMLLLNSRITTSKVREMVEKLARERARVFMWVKCYQLTRRDGKVTRTNPTHEAEEELILSSYEEVFAPLEINEHELTHLKICPTVIYADEQTESLVTSKMMRFAMMNRNDLFQDQGVELRIPSLDRKDWLVTGPRASGYLWANGWILLITSVLAVAPVYIAILHLATAQRRHPITKKIGMQPVNAAPVVGVPMGGVPMSAAPMGGVPTFHMHMNSTAPDQCV